MHKEKLLILIYVHHEFDKVLFFAQKVSQKYNVMPFYVQYHDFQAKFKAFISHWLSLDYRFQVSTVGGRFMLQMPKHYQCKKSKKYNFEFYFNF